MITITCLSSHDEGVLHYKNNGAPHRAWFDNTGVYRTTENNFPALPDWHYSIPSELNEWLQENANAIAMQKQAIQNRKQWSK